MIHFGPVEIDPIALGSQGSAILGIRDSGKTYTAMMLAEQLMDAGIPIFAFDPVGVWRFLRIPGAGRGYPVVVAGGKEGDLPLTPDAVPALVEAAMKSGVSLIFDLFDINLSKADWRRIVTAALRTLLHENHQYGLRHVFIEEAAEFAPQKVMDGHVYAEMEKLARMGGNARLGYTLINQRSEEVNKALLELCDNLFLHRQKGRNSLTALQRWLDVGNVADGKRIISSLSTLPTGQCWAWMQGSDEPTLVQVPAKNSLHPDRRVIRGEEGAVTAKAVDVKAFVEAMRKELSAPAPQEVEAKAPSAAETAQARADGKREGRAEGLAEGLRQGRAGVLHELQSWLNEQAERGDQVGVAGEELRKGDLVSIQLAPRDPEQRIFKADRRPAAPQMSGAMGLVQAAAQVHPVKLTWGQVAALAGRKPTGGHFNTSKKTAIENGWMVESGGLVSATAEGMKAADVKPRRGDPADVFEEVLPQPARKMFSAIRRAPGITTDRLAAELGMKPVGGHWNTGMSMLRKNNLIAMEGQGLLAVDLRKAK